MKLVEPLPYTRPMHDSTQPPRPRVSLAYMLVLSLSLHVALLMLLPAPRVHEVRIDPPILARLTPAEPRTPVTHPPAEATTASATSVPPRSIPDAAAPVTDAPPPRPAEIEVPPTPPAAPPMPLTPPTPSPPAQAVPAAAMPHPLTETGIALPIDPTWYPTRQLDRPPRGMNTITPEYPREARRRGIEGNVRLRLRIDEEGRVREAEALEGTPPGMFEAAALAAFESARYTPALRNGRAVRSEIEIRVVFRLD